MIISFWTLTFILLIIANWAAIKDHDFIMYYACVAITILPVGFAVGEQLANRYL